MISSSTQWMIDARCSSVGFAPPQITLHPSANNGLRSGLVIAAALADVCFREDTVAKVFLSHRSQIFRAVGAAIEY